MGYETNILDTMTNSIEQFDTRPDAVDLWLNNLPVAHVGESARQLYTALKTVNHQESVPVKQHFYFLENTSKQIMLLLPELHRHYAGKPLPLSPKRRKVADLYTQLVRQLINGYQTVISSSIELNRFGWKKTVTTSIHRIFSLQGLMLSNYRMLYMPYPRGTWQQIYWLYHIADNDRLLKAKVSNIYGAARKSSIETEFNKLLLFSLLSPNLFKAKQYLQTIEYMDFWSKYTRVEFTARANAEHTYAFMLQTDIPPGLVSEKLTDDVHNNPLDIRYFDISPLLKIIEKALNSAKHGKDKIKLARNLYFSRRNLLILLNSWGRPASRDSERRVIQGHAELAIGISAIHYIANNVKTAPQLHFSEPTTSTDDNSSDSFTLVAAPSRHEQISSMMSLGFNTDRENNSDVWSNAFFEPEAPPPSWTESIQMKVYSYLDVKVLNISKGGYCVSIPQEGIEHIQTNELIAIRGKNGNWQLCEIRWLVCPTSGPIRAGLKKLGQRILPVHLLINSNMHHTHPIKALFCSNDEHGILYLPSVLKNLEDKELQLELNEQKLPVNLHNLVYQTNQAIGYELNILSTNHEESDKPPHREELDAYSSIWASL